MDTNRGVILISGGTGMVGTALTNHLLQEGYSVIILTRDPKRAKPMPEWGNRVSYAAWDVKNQWIDQSAIEKADALIHLAGAGVVDKPWSEAYKKEILDSRVKSSELLCKAIKDHGSRMKTVVSASAIGWYGADRPEDSKPFTEEDPAATGFLGETCKLWEESIQQVTESGKRLVICRIGIVMSNQGGALPEFKKSLKFRVAGILGSGNQMVSWVHIDDLCRIFQFAVENEAMSGVFNAAAPSPVSNRTLNHELGKSMYGKGFISLPVPAFVIKLMLGDRSIEVLKSTLVSSKKLLETGFTFTYPDIQKALKHLVHEAKKKD